MKLRRRRVGTHTHTFVSRRSNVLLERNKRCVLVGRVLRPRERSVAKLLYDANPAYRRRIISPGEGACR